MQKVEGSNPFSRFEEGLQLAGFLGSTVGKCVCVAGQEFAKRRRRGPPAPSEKTLVCRMIPLVWTYWRSAKTQKVTGSSRCPRPPTVVGSNPISRVQGSPLVRVSCSLGRAPVYGAAWALARNWRRHRSEQNQSS